MSDEVNGVEREQTASEPPTATPVATPSELPQVRRRQAGPDMAEITLPPKTASKNPVPSSKKATPLTSLPTNSQSDLDNFLASKGYPVPDKPIQSLPTDSMVNNDSDKPVKREHTDSDGEVTVPKRQKSETTEDHRPTVPKRKGKAVNHINEMSEPAPTPPKGSRKIKIKSKATDLAENEEIVGDGTGPFDEEMLGEDHRPTYSGPDYLAGEGSDSDSDEDDDDGFGDLGIATDEDGSPAVTTGRGKRKAATSSGQTVEHKDDERKTRIFRELITRGFENCYIMQPTDDRHAWYQERYDYWSKNRGHKDRKQRSTEVVRDKGKKKTDHDHQPIVDVLSLMTIFEKHNHRLAKQAIVDAWYDSVEEHKNIRQNAEAFSAHFHHRLRNAKGIPRERVPETPTYTTTEVGLLKWNYRQLHDQFERHKEKCDAKIDELTTLAEQQKAEIVRLKDQRQQLWDTYVENHHRPQRKQIHELAKKLAAMTTERDSRLGSYFVEEPTDPRLELTKGPQHLPPEQTPNPKYRDANAQTEWFSTEQAARPAAIAKLKADREAQEAADRQALLDMEKAFEEEQAQQKREHQEKLEAFRKTRGINN